MPWLKPWIRAEYLLIGSTAAAERPVLWNDGGGCELKTTTDAVGVLRGRLITIPHHDDKATGKAARNLIAALRRDLTLFADSSPRGGRGDVLQIRADAEQKISEAESKGVQIISADFELYRTGQLNLTLTKIPAVDTAVSSGQIERKCQILAQQLYYFVKDVSHRHYHHDPSDDNILPLAVVTPTDDVSWRRETLWSLARAILEVRRRDHLTHYKAALGILSYAQAFQALIARVKREPSGHFVLCSEVAPYDFEHTTASIEAKVDERAWISTGWSQFWTVILTTSIAAGALWIGAVQVRDAACLGINRHSTVEAIPSPVPAYSGEAIYKPATTKTSERFALQLRPVLNGDRPRAAQDNICQRGKIPPITASGLLLAIEHPRGLLATVLLLTLFYFEYARRSLRSVKAGRYIYSSPWEWLTALGVTISRSARKYFPMWGDRIGQIVAIVVAAMIIALLARLFVVLL